MQTLINHILDLAVDIQQIAAPTFAEANRARFVYDLYLREGLADVEIDEVGNVYGRIAGDGDAAPLVICAHLDTVFPAETDLHLSRVHPNQNDARDLNVLAGPGIGDNSLGVAGMFGLLWLLRAQKRTLRGDIWLVATVGEEGLGDLYGMRAVVDRFENAPLVYLVLEGMALGHIYHRALGARRFRVSAYTEGGHSWGHFGRPSAVHVLANLIDQLVALPLPENPRTTLNVGVFVGGTSINTIAAEASFELDLRSESPTALTELVEAVQMLVAAANKPKVEVVAEPIGDRPAGGILESHPLAALAERALIHVGVQPILTIGSTDANIPLSRGYPALCLGITTGEGAHTKRELIHADYVEAGMRQLLYFVENLWT